MIIYALISRHNTVLVEFTSVSGNFPTITRTLLQKIKFEDTKMSYVYDKYVFHYIIENNVMYMCMSDDLNKRRIPFAFLEDIKAKFKLAYDSNVIQTAIAFSMNNDFGRVLHKQMDYFNSPQADTISVVATKLDDVKNVMIENIEMVLERGEKLELLVDKSEELHQQAFKFQKSARQLKSAMIWKRVKLYTLIFVVVALIIWVITVIACGITYSKCKK